MNANYVITCENSRLVHVNELSYCKFISWSTVNIYYNSTIYEKIQQSPITADEQDRLAYQYSLTISNNKHNSKLCYDAIRRFSCIKYFPYCSAPNQFKINNILVTNPHNSVSYLKPCELQCSQLNEICYQDNIKLDCDGLANNHNCMIYVPSNVYLLNPNLGPYDAIFFIYCSLLAFWVLITYVWYYRGMKYISDSSLLVTKLLVVMPFLKLLLLILACFLWFQCASNGFMCPVYFSVLFVAFYHIFEAVLLFIFAIISRGLSITQQTLSFSEWRFIWFGTLLFYLASTVVLNSFSSFLLLQILFIAVIYGTVYWFILHKTCIELAILRIQISKLQSNIAYQNTEESEIIMKVLVEKHTKYKLFLILVLLLIILEIICQTLYIIQQVSYIIIIIIYEVVSMIIIVMLGNIFQSSPQEISPFYYIIPTSLEACRVVSQRNTDQDLTATHGRTVSTEVYRAAEVILRRHDQDSLMDRFREALSMRPTPIVELFLRPPPSIIINSNNSSNNNNNNTRFTTANSLRMTSETDVLAHIIPNNSTNSNRISSHVVEQQLASLTFINTIRNTDRNRMFYHNLSTDIELFNIESNVSNESQQQPEAEEYSRLLAVTDTNNEIVLAIHHNHNSEDPTINPHHAQFDYHYNSSTVIYQNIRNIINRLLWNHSSTNQQHMVVPME